MHLVLRLLEVLVAAFLSCPFVVNGLNHFPQLLDRRFVISKVLPTSVVATTKLVASKVWLSPSEEKKESLDTVVVMLHEAKNSMDQLALDLIKREDQLHQLSAAVVTIPCDDATPMNLATVMDELADKFGRKNKYRSPLLAVVGHGLGGTMSMWTALRCLLPPQSGTVSVLNSQHQFIPSVAVSLNGLLDVPWALEQQQMARTQPWFQSEQLRWVSPIDLLPPATKSMRLQESRNRSLVPANCRLSVVHGEQDTIVPVAHSIRFTVAACTGGVEVDLHRMKKENHFDCLDPASDSWKVARSILQHGWSPNNNGGRSKAVLQIGRDEIMEPQRMKQTIREETDSEIIIQTLREVPLYK